MTLISEHVETDTRERILVVAERLFRQSGYQKTTVADIAKELRMSPANVYRFFGSKKAIDEGVARVLMGGVDDVAHDSGVKPGTAAPQARQIELFVICEEPTGRECAPDDRLRDEAIQPSFVALEWFAALAMTK